MRYLLVLLLVGCSSLPKVPEQILIPITKSCISVQPTKPDFISHEVLKTLADDKLIKQVGLELFKYEAYTAELESILKACK
jgi:hypothetical protein